MGRERGSSFSFGGLGKSKSEDTATAALDVYHIGLLNLGNSCFYNTILQSLSVSRPLADLIEHPTFTSPALQLLSPSSAAFNEDPSTYLSPLPISSALVVILAKLDPELKEARPKTFNPKGLLRELSKKYEEYAAATQQDAHEVLRHLIDGIMMEEVDLIKKILMQPPVARPLGAKRRNTVRANEPPKIGSVSTPLSSLPEDASAADSSQAMDADSDEDSQDEVAVGERVSADEHDADSSSDSSSDTSDEDEDVSEDKKKFRVLQQRKRKTKMRPFIDQIFGGKLASVVVCEECKNVSLTREDFMDLSLSLKDDGARLRKRDRIRKSLQAGFFSKKSSAESAAKPSSSALAPPRPAFARRETTSLSEAEGSASETGSDFESESNDDDIGAAARAHRARRKSLEPNLLSREQRKPLWAAGTSGTPAASRDPSPLGRALSVVSSSARSGKVKKGKIPKPTKEQLAYIRKVLADIPGPAPSPLPAGLRFAQPVPGSASTTGDVSAAAQSLAQLKLQGSHAADATTDLYACLQQFTAVETLDSENSFACRNCWKLLNPDLVHRRQEEKLARRQARAEKQRKESQDPSGMDEDGATPLQGSPAREDAPPAWRDNVPSIVASSVVDRSEGVSAVPFSTDSSKASQSSVSLESASTASSTGGDVEDAGESSDTSADATCPPPSTVPLTEENVQALAPASSSSALPSASLSATGHGVPTESSIQRAPSGASLSTRFSESTNLSKRRTSASAPSRRERHILRRAHKRYLISAKDLPPVLVIHFKRFMQMSKTPLFGTPFSNLKKRDDDLTFPEVMDLSPFLTPTERPPQPTLPTVRPARMSRRASTAPLVMPSAQYRLYAVVVHIGTLAGGHYVNFVLSDRYADPRRPPTVNEEGETGIDTVAAEREKEQRKPPRRWFYCSDDEIRPCSVEEVLKSKAYMLFYERIEKTSAVPKSRI